MWYFSYIMKLYLSSYKLGNNPEKFAQLFGENKNVGIIMNAGDVYPSEKRGEYLSREISNLAQIALRGEDLDLRKYFGKPEDLASLLNGLGGVWVMGGNSFVLRRAMRQSGFDELIHSLIKQNQLVYGGFSAGAVVTSPNLRGIDIVDSPEDVPDDYNKDIIWDGLGLIDFSIAPHYKSDHPESGSVDRVVDYFEHNNVAYKALHDGEVIIVSE